MKNEHYNYSSKSRSKKISIAVRRAIADGRLRQQQKGYRKGIPATGILQKGSKDHPRTGEYVLESPRGTIHTFYNLADWCYKNEALFPPDKRKYKLPLWQRAAIGIARQFTDKDVCRYQWKGWKLLKVMKNNPEYIDRIISLVG